MATADVEKKQGHTPSMQLHTVTAAYNPKLETWSTQSTFSSRRCPRVSQYQWIVVVECLDTNQKEQGASRGYDRKGNRLSCFTPSAINACLLSFTYILSIFADTALTLFPADPYTTAPNQTSINLANLAAMICPLTQEAYARQLGKNFIVPHIPLPLFRRLPKYESIPVAWNLPFRQTPLVFGTYGLTERPESLFLYEAPTADEAAVSAYMQGTWVAFAKDSASGLANYDKWPTWTPGNETNVLVELGLNNKPGAVFAPSGIYVSLCPGLRFNVGP